jgi:hypothetical protein
MDSKFQNILVLTERLLLHVEHGIPPEVEVIDELRKLIGEVRREHGIPSPVAKSLPGTT